MRSLLALNPFEEMRQMIQNMDRLFGATDTGGWIQWPSEQAVTLPIDVYEKGNDLVIQASVPGVKPEDIDISIENGVLTISGQFKKQEPQEGEVRWHRREYSYGAFTRSIRLPEQLEFDKAKADFSDGMVMIAIPGVEKLRTKAQKVPLSVSGKALGEPTHRQPREETVTERETAKKR